jgi:glutamate-1-semialdehyde 2,1-aminomutase
MNDLDSAAMQEIQDSFCIYPFVAMNIMPSGTVKPCCAFGHTLESNGRQMSVYEQTVEEIWNSDEMRDIRRKMVEGEPVAGCNYCYEQERKGLRSMWIDWTENWQYGIPSFNPERETIPELKERIRTNGFKVHDGPQWFALDVGNQCNLKCRMCNASYSSGIEKDPVHSRWTGLPELPPSWHGDNLIIGPRPVLGVTYEGFSYPEWNSHIYRSWTNGNASLRLNAAELDIIRLSIKIADEKPENHPVTITVNGSVLFSDSISSELEFDMPPLKTGGELEIRVESPVFVHPKIGQSVGIGIEEIKLIRSSNLNHSDALGRLSSGKRWYQDLAFLEYELLAHPQQLRMLTIIGGEPLLIKEVRYILRHLVERGVARNITLLISTNGTCADNEWFDLLSNFQSINMQISVDGHGGINEYIRSPSKWKTIEENIALFNNQPNTWCDVNMTVQAYNILNIVEVIDFCDRLGIGFRGHLLQWPDHLSPFALPIQIRQLAADRLRNYATQRDSTLVCNRHEKSHAKSLLWSIARTLSSEIILALASMLEGGPQEVNNSLLQRFMLFTNDLDASRGQNFANSIPELHGLIELYSFPWIQKLIFAQLPSSGS